jgi:hypothetical protein
VSCLNAPLQVGVLVGDCGFGDLEYVEDCKLFIIEVRDTCNGGLARTSCDPMGLNAAQDGKRSLG